MTRTDDNIKELINVNVKYPKSEFSGSNTYATLFMSPAFDVPMNDIGMYEHFVNSYIDDYGLTHLFKRPFFVLVKVRDFNPRFAKLDRMLKDNRNYVYTYPVGTEKGELLFMYVFECPKAHVEDYDAFLSGKYSKFTTGYKQRFQRTLQTIRGDVIENPLYGAIYKTSSLKKRVESIIGENLEPSQEYFGIPVGEMEIFRFSNN